MSCIWSHVLQPSQYSASSFSSTFLIMISSPPASPLFNHNKKTKNKKLGFHRVLSDIKHPNKGSGLHRDYVHSSLAQQWLESTFLQQADCLRTTTFKQGMSQSKALHTPSAPGNCATLHHFFCLWSQWNNYVLSFGGIQVQSEGSSKRSFPTERQCCSPRDTGLTGSTNLKVNNPPKSHGKYKK